MKIVDDDQTLISRDATVLDRENPDCMYNPVLELLWKGYSNNLRPSVFPEPGDKFGSTVPYH